MNYVLFKFDFWCLLLVQQSSVISSTWEDYYYYLYYEVLNALHWLCTDVSLYQAQWLAHSRHLQEWISSVLQKKQGNKNYCSLSFSLSLWMITLPLSFPIHNFFFLRLFWPLSSPLFTVIELDHFQYYSFIVNHQLWWLLEGIWGFSQSHHAINGGNSVK